MDMQGTKKDEDKDEEIQNVKDFEEENFELKVDLSDSQVPKDAQVVICNPGTAQAIIRIVFDDKLTKCGGVKATYKEKEEEVLVFHTVAGQNLFVIFVESAIKSLYLGQIIAQIWPTFKAQNASFVALNSSYKTTQTTPDGHMSIDAERLLPLRYTRSSHKNDRLDSLLTTGNAWSGHI